MSEASPPPPPLQPLRQELHFTDMRALLIIMGILIMIGGLACGCGNGPSFDLMPMLLMVAASPEYSLPNTSAAATICFGLFYLVSAATMVWLGMGSILVQKWARSLLYAMGWFQAAILLGSVVCAIPIFTSVFSFAKSMAPATTPGGPPPGVVAAQVSGVLAMLLGTQLAFRIVPAAVLIILYGLRNVRHTTEYFDPQPRWTDRFSVEMLCWWIFLNWAGCLCLLFGPTYAVAGHEMKFPLNPIVTGISIAVTGIFLLVIAVATARREPWAWVAGLSVVLTALSALIVTLASFNFADYVAQRFPITPGPDNQAMNDVQKEVIRFLENPQVFWMPVVLATGLLVSFLVWIKPQFQRDWVRGKTAPAEMG